MAITSETAQNLLLDAGVVYINYGLGAGQGERILGATEGGNKFKIEREIKEIELDGVKGKTKGLRRIISENASLEVNLKELSAENIALALAGSAVSDYPTVAASHDEIRSSGTIASSDYIDNVALVAKISGSGVPVICILENVIADGNFEIGATHNDEAVVPVVFSAHFDPDVDEVPYAIRYPKMDAADLVLSDVTTLDTKDATIVKQITNLPIGSEAIRVVAATSVSGILTAVEATDDSLQTYAVTDHEDTPKTSGTLVTGDILVVTAEDGTATADYTITVASA